MLLMLPLLIAAGEGEMKTLFATHGFVGDAQGLPLGWLAESAHDGVRPEFAVEPGAGRAGQGALRLAAKGNPAVFGNVRRNVPGIVAGCLLVFIPSVGEFVIPYLLGGTRTLMIGKVLWDEFFTNADWPLASAVAICLLALLVGPMMPFQRHQAQSLEHR